MEEVVWGAYVVIDRSNAIKKHLALVRASDQTGFGPENWSGVLPW